MIFKAYPKIHRLGKEETDGLIEGTEETLFLTIQEKIDGANTSIWLDDEGVVQCGSRTRQLPTTESFNGFVEWARAQEPIVSYLKEYPDRTLYGEWLVRHTIAYNEMAYKKWYLFDIYDNTNEEFIPSRDVALVAEKYGFNTPTVFAEGYMTEEQIKEHVGKSTLGNEGEGVVIKRYGFKNKFGDHCYAKVVTQKFKENNAITFGGNNKHSETYQEMYFVQKYCTLARVEKIMHKMQPKVNKRLDLEHIPMISGACYHDMITEEAWEIAQMNRVVDFKQLRRLANAKFIQIYKDFITGDISVADRDNKQ
ncbi:ATP-dependent DNA ligase [Caudoviricetes sp.]|nr:ATP-dependent DNA ligase [Caudoviricetes sp.]